MAIVRVETKERAYEIADGCLAGGIDVIEISYTNNNAGEIINCLKQKYLGRLLVGAGTVLDSETARSAILKGADFIIAPTFSKKVAKMSNRYQVPYAPGCTSFTEAVEALEYGASFIKAFPISNFYGSQLVKVFKTPMPEMPILASGGANLENIQEWFESGVDCVGLGGLLTRGTTEEITRNAKLLHEKMKLVQKV
nr:ketohydroxyglutarate aldolase [Enterococcus sp. 665A]